MSFFNGSMNNSIEQLPEKTCEKTLASSESQRGWIRVGAKKKNLRKVTSLFAPAAQSNQLLTPKVSSTPTDPLSRQYAIVASLPPPTPKPNRCVAMKPITPPRAPIHLGTTKCRKTVENTSFDINDEKDFPKIGSTIVKTLAVHPERPNLLSAVEKKKSFGEKEITCYFPHIQNQDCSNSSVAESRVNQYGGGRKRKLSQKLKKISKRQQKEATEEEEPSIQPKANYRNGTGAPTKEELEFLDKYTVASEAEKFIKRSKLYVSLKPVMYRFRNYETITDKLDVLHHHCAKIFDIIIRKNVYAAGGNMNTKFWFGLDSPGYNTKLGQWVVNHKTPAFFGGSEVVNILATHMQSNKTLKLDRSLEIYMNVFKEPEETNLSGKGRPVEKKLPKRGVRRAGIRDYHLSHYFGDVLVVGTTHCLPKALAIGKIKADLKSPRIDDQTKRELERKFRNITRMENVESGAAAKHQLRMAKQLLEAAGMDPSVETHTLEDLKTLSTFLSEYQIKLWVCEENETVPHEQLHLNEDGHSFIGLVHFNNHFECVDTLKRETNGLRFCYKCSKWDTSNHHKKCKAKCWYCGSVKCTGQGCEKINCDKCNIYFKSQDCYDQHLKPINGQALPNCAKFFYCTKCHHYDRRSRYAGAPHVCGATTFCHICRIKAKHGHTCEHHLPNEDEKKKKAEKQEKWVAVVYDMECIVAESGEYRGSVTRGPAHKPNMIVAKVLCNECRGKDCTKCGEAQVFSYMDGVVADGDRNVALEGFIKFLLEDSRVHRKDVWTVKVLAHNGGRYDHLLCLRGIEDFLGKKAPNPSLITNGWTIISARLNYKGKTLHFLDSLQFLQMSLSKMPAAFGLTGEAKGFFPYLYNHPENYEKVLNTLPAREYYDPDRMAPAQRVEFDKWYTENSSQKFKLFDEMEKYCRSDVRILTLALVSFIDICESIFDGWNPILNATTLASYVMFVMRHKYIKNGDVGVIPENGYGGGKNSVFALKYIQWLEKTTPGLCLQYQLRGGEKLIRVNGRCYSADGYDEKTNEVYEINGCLYHGCPKCYPDPDAFSPLEPGLKMLTLREKTAQRVTDLESAGYTVHTKWACEIRKELRLNKEMRTFFKLCNHTRRLQPREALYGGRTQAFRSKAKATIRVKLGYYDFTSLYPYMNAGGTAYPRGNPTVLTSGFPDVNEPLKLRGLIFCDVLPTPDAPIGFLPQKVQGKLMFPLCRTCVNDQNVSGTCTHTKISERFLTGVWMTDELNYAIARGYRVLKYHEIWHWKAEDWVTDGFFGDYIKPLLKLKHESSGWPRSDWNEEKKVAYIEKIFTNDGVRLDRDKIVVNKALRSLAKLFLNSAWGKFVQNPMKMETKLFRESDCVGVKRYLDDPKYEPVDMKPFGEDKVFISRRPKKECLDQNTFTNIAIGAQTTCGGRLRLLEAMELAGYENLIYCDTDSIIFKSERGTDPLAALIGEQLGFLTDEIPEGLELCGVVVMAPKVYGLKMVDKDGNFSYVVKAKGVRMTSGNAEKVTFDRMSEAMDCFISSGHTEPITTEMMTFKRGDHLLDGLWSCISEKKLNPTMDKGHYVEGVAVPFGQLSSDTILEDDYPFY